MVSQGNVQNSGGVLGLIYGRNSSVSCIHGVKSNGLIKTNLYTVYNVGGKHILKQCEALERSEPGEYHQTQKRPLS
jgi:hypothetical protein